MNCTFDRRTDVDVNQIVMEALRLDSDEAFKCPRTNTRIQEAFGLAIDASLGVHGSRVDLLTPEQYRLMSRRPFSFEQLFTDAIGIRYSFKLMAEVGGDTYFSLQSECSSWQPVDIDEPLGSPNGRMPLTESFRNIGTAFMGFSLIGHRDYVERLTPIVKLLRVGIPVGLTGKDQWSVVLYPAIKKAS